MTTETAKALQTELANVLAKPGVTIDYSCSFDIDRQPYDEKLQIRDGSTGRLVLDLCGIHVDADDVLRAKVRGCFMG